MKIGRNAPCPCGSGKKYKRCCLNKAKVVVREVVVEDDEVIEEPVAATLEIAPSSKPPVIVDEPDDLLMSAIYKFYETFESADYATKWTLAEKMLVEEPELCDEETAFEIGNSLFGDAVEADDYARFLSLSRQMERHAPKAWAYNQEYMLEWETIFALIVGDHAVATSAFMRLSDTVADHIETYYRVMSAVAWYGKVDLVIAGMRRALPSINASTDIMGWAKDQFVEKIADFETVNALALYENSADAAPALTERFTTEYKLEISDTFEQMLAYLFGERTPSAAADLYEFDSKNAIEDDPAATHVSRLVHAFFRYAIQEEQIPSVRVAQVKNYLGQYIALSSIGELQTKPSTTHKNNRKRRRTKVQKRAKKQTALIPERRQVDAYIAQYISSFLFTPYYDIAGFVELLPAWLRFLNVSELVTASQVEDALTDLKPLVDAIIVLCERGMSDPVVIERLRVWPNNSSYTDRQS